MKLSIAEIFQKAGHTLAPKPTTYKRKTDLKKVYYDLDKDDDYVPFGVD